jgi:PAS domain S-box-containing protein
MNYNDKHRILLVVLLLAWTPVLIAQKENMGTITDFRHLATYLGVAMLIAVIVMVIYNRIYYYRKKKIDIRASQLNTQLGLVLVSNKTQVWTYNNSKKVYLLMSDKGEKQTEYSPIDFSQFYHHEDFTALRKKMAALVQQQIEKETMIVRGSRQVDGQEQLYEISISVLHRNKHGNPKILIGIQRDITEEKKRQEEARNLSMRFHTVFNSSLVDMIYYDENGILTDINDKACETFNVTDREALLKRKVKITDIPSYRDMDFNHLDNIKISSITDIDQVKKEDERVPEANIGGKFYYEVTVNSIFDEAQHLQGVVAAGRNITEMVQSHHRQQENRLLLEKRTKDIQNYIENINYTLRVTGVRLINYYPDTHELEVFSDLNKAEYRLSQIRCASLLDERDRRRARGLLLRMDRRNQGTFMQTFRTRLRDEQGRAIYLTFNMVPVADKDGRITHYFGMCRNDTEMHDTEARLREETKKAQETEELKNTFLMNMSYEIRTPLNAVLGFAELFNGPHDEADEPVFAEEIKHNTGDLLALINDILFISRLDANMVEYNYQECDFANIFDGYCYMGWSTVNPQVKVSVENPYNHLFVTIDGQNLGEVIRKICATASHHTREGSIRAKYDYRHGELSIAIEDTGKGLSKEELAHVFDRFARSKESGGYGTGLELPIIRALVEQMGGSIEIQSEVGKGNTVYVIIPCEMSSLEKKAEMDI